MARRLWLRDWTASVFCGFINEGSTVALLCRTAPLHPCEAAPPHLASFSAGAQAAAKRARLAHGPQDAYVSSLLLAHLASSRHVHGERLLACSLACLLAAQWGGRAGGTHGQPGHGRPFAAPQGTAAVPAARLPPKTPPLPQTGPCSGAGPAGPAACGPAVQPAPSVSVPLATARLGWAPPLLRSWRQLERAPHPS